MERRCENCQRIRYFIQIKTAGFLVVKGEVRDLCTTIWQCPRCDHTVNESELRPAVKQKKTE